MPDTYSLGDAWGRLACGGFSSGRIRDADIPLETRWARARHTVRLVISTVAHAACRRPGESVARWTEKPHATAGDAASHPVARGLVITVLLPLAALIAAPPEATAQCAGVICQGVQATHCGDGGPNVLNGTPFADVIHGLGGDDQIRGRGGSDIICGGEGDDEIRGGSGNDRIRGGPGDDVIDGNGGEDEIFGGQNEDTIDGGRGADTIFGEEHRDVIRGQRGDDKRLAGGDGNDRVYGGRGSDRINGGIGDDKLFGEAGDDTIFGDEDVDRIKGGSGDDEIRGGQGRDVIDGNGGGDRIFGGAPVRGSRAGRAEGERRQRHPAWRPLRVARQPAARPSASAVHTGGWHLRRSAGHAEGRLGELRVSKTGLRSKSPRRRVHEYVCHQRCLLQLRMLPIAALQLRSALNALRSRFRNAGSRGPIPAGRWLPAAQWTAASVDPFLLASRIWSMLGVRDSIHHEEPIMVATKELCVGIADKPGTLGLVSEELGRVGINIDGFGVWGGCARLMVDDLDPALEALREAGFDCHSKRVLKLDLPDEPGNLSEVARELGRAGINIDYAYTVTSQADGAASFVLAVIDSVAADEALD